MKGHVCKICKFISITESAPDKCPVCGPSTDVGPSLDFAGDGAPKTTFEEKENAVLTPKDANNKTELEKKHEPLIIIVRKCGLIAEGCTDVHVKMGEILHPMQPEHFIRHIDFYIDKGFIARVHLTPEALNPAAALHLKAGGGPSTGVGPSRAVSGDRKLAVIALCNIHGAWIKEVDL